MTADSSNSTKSAPSRFDFENASQKTYDFDDIQAYLKDHRAHNEAAFEEADKEISGSDGFYGYRMAAAGVVGGLIAETYSSLKVSGVLNETEAASARSRCAYAMHVNDLLKLGPKAMEAEVVEQAIVNILGFGQIIPELLITTFAHRSDVLVKGIKGFHNDLGSEWAYPTNDFKSKLKAQGSKDEVLNQHEEFLEHNKNQNQDVVDNSEDLKLAAIQDLKADIHHKKMAISDLEGRSYEPGSSSESGRLEKLSKHKEELKSLEQHLDNSDHWPDTVEVVQAKDMLTKINAQEEHVALGRHRADYAKTSGRLGALDSGIGMARLGLNLRDFTEESITDPSLGDAVLTTYGVSSLLGLPQLAGDLLGKAPGKLTKGTNFFGSLLGVAAGSMSIADYSKALDDPNLTETQERFIHAELGLQATAVGLSAIEGGLSVALSAVKAGSMASKVLGKAVPAIGVLAAVVSAINPAQFAAFEQQEEQIKTIRAIDDHSSDFMADALQGELDLEKDMYIASTVVDVAVSIGVAIAAATSASGIGAVVGLAIAGLAMLISSLVQEALMEELRQEYREKMLTDEDGNAQTYQDYANASFDKQQEILKGKHEDFFKKLIDEGGYNSVSAVSGAWLTGTDKWMFAFTQRGQELNRTATSYHEEYTSTGEWVDHSTGIQQSNTLLLPELGDGSKRYVYSMSPMSLNFETFAKTTNKHTNLDYWRSEIKGWHVKDQGDVDTVFNLDKVISKFIDTSGYQIITGRKVVFSGGGKGSGFYNYENIYESRASNVKVDIDLKITAGGGDDVVLLSDVRTIADGGDGKDVASYTSLGVADMTRGLTVHASAYGAFHVQKYFAAGSEYYTEQIEETKKDGDIFESKQLVIETRTKGESKKDTLKNFEVLQTTDYADEVDLSGGETSLKTVSTFSGDDTIVMGDHLVTVIAGEGNDKVIAGKAARRIFMEDGDDIVDFKSVNFSDYQIAPEDLADNLTDEEVAGKTTMISGGDGDDTIVISNEMFRHMTARYFEDAAVISAALELTKGYTDIESTPNVSMDRLLLRDFEWVRFNAKDYKTSASSVPEETNKLLFNRDVSIYGNLEQLNALELREKALEYSASGTSAGSSRFDKARGINETRWMSKSDLSDGRLSHETGEIYLKKGTVFKYEIMTTSLYSVYIDGELIGYRDGYEGKKAEEYTYSELHNTYFESLKNFAYYTAKESKYHRIDNYHQLDANSPLNFYYFSDSLKWFGEVSLPEGLVDSKYAEFFSFQTRALNTVVKGTQGFYLTNGDDQDNIHYMAEYRDIANASINHSESSRDHLYEEGVIYDSNLKVHSQTRAVYESEIKDLIPTSEFHELNGKIFLEAGKKYYFEVPQLKIKDYAGVGIVVDGREVTSEHGRNTSMTKEHTVETDGLYNIGFFMYHRLDKDSPDDGNIHYTPAYRTSEDGPLKYFVYGNDTPYQSGLTADEFQYGAVSQSYIELKETGVLYNAKLITLTSRVKHTTDSEDLKQTFSSWHDGYGDYFDADSTALDNKDALSNVVRSKANNDHMHGYIGRFYVERGNFYEFQEAKWPDVSALYLDGQLVFRDDVANVTAYGKYEARETGWVSFEYYVHNAKGAKKDTYKLTHRANGKGSWQNIKMEAEHYAAKGLVDAFVVFTNNSKKIIHEVEDGERLKGELPMNTKFYVEGEIFFEAGETYYFDTETTSGVALSIDDTNISHNRGVFTYEATETGYHTLAYTQDSRGNYDLRFKQHGDKDFIPMAGQEAITDDPSVNVDFSAKDIEHEVVLIGSEYDDKMEGSDFHDIITGDTGRDIIEGGKGNDVLSGGYGGDRFVFGADSGHDLISEMLYVEDQFQLDTFEFNNLNFNDDNSYDLITRDGNFVLLTYENNNLDTSVTWVDFMSDKRSVSSTDIFTMIDESGNEMFISQDTASAQLSSTFDNLSYDIQQDYLANVVV